MKNYAWLCLFVLLLSCSANNRFSQAGIPEKYSIKYNSHGGMAPFSTTIFFSNQDSSYVDFFANGVRNKIPIFPKKENLDALVKTIRVQKFDQIKTREEEAMDRGGNAVSIDFDGEKFRVSNMGFSFVKTKWEPNYHAILDHIMAIAKKNADEQLIPIQIELDSTFKEANTLVDLGLNQSMFIRWSVDTDSDNLKLNYQAKAMHGENSFHCNIFKRVRGKQAQHLVYWNAPIKFNAENKHIKLTRVGNEITHTFLETD